jgi:hypothetical protein
VSWSPEDRAELDRREIAPAEAERQLELLRHPPPPALLVRPATVGDGIERLTATRVATLLELGDSARRSGRLTKFVPASGAATRMFRALVAVRERLPGATLEALRARAGSGDADALDTAEFVAALPRLALARPLAARLGLTVAGLIESSRQAPLDSLFDRLLLPDGLDALGLPKALLPFHARGQGTVTAFEEHLDEGLGYVADRAGRARFAFTVPPGARAQFEERLAFWRERQPASPVDVDFSEQSPATDTLALDADGAPARTGDGRLLFRPSGHGALLPNLEATGGDLALVKNIDNILPAARHTEIARARLILVGRLVELELTSPRTRPLRVCGVVANRGEPGGGPFWVSRSVGGSVGGVKGDAEDEPTLQIVESSQLASDDPAQAAIWRASTHFNPVDLAVSLRDSNGQRFPLARWVDPSSSFVTRKSEGGRELTVLERPGLWNGAMAGWKTVFVELPDWTFAPVKSVLDLARPEHAAESP